MLFRSSYLPILFDFLTQKGAADAVDVIRRELEIPEPDGDLLKAVTVPIETFRAANERAAALLGDDLLGLHMAMERRTGSYGIVEYAARNAADVEDALTRVAQYVGLVSEAASIELFKGPNEASVSHRLPDEPLGPGRHVNEFTLAMLHIFIREATDKPIRPLRVEFPHEAPSDPSHVEQLKQFFETTDLHFGTDRNQLTYENEVFALPVVAGDPKLLPWLEKYADTLLTPESGVIQRMPGLHEHIRQCLDTKTTPTLSEIARRMQLSGRTLQRRLQDANTSFQDELDEVRRDLAESYLRDRKLTIYEIALLLGYSDRSGFERAFMKWRGATPGGFRRKMAQEKLAS